MKRHTARYPGLATLAALAVSAAGCGKLGPPESYQTARVVGRVHLGKVPYHGGWIEFLPTDGARGHIRSAPIDQDGRFELTRVATGMNAVRLVRTSGPISLGRKFEQFHTSPIRRRIEPSPSVTIDIDIREEAARETAQK